MLINLLKHAWHSFARRRTIPTLPVTKPVDAATPDEFSLCEHLRESPGDLEAWCRLGGLVAARAPDVDPSEHAIPGKQAIEAFWAATTAAGLAHKANQPQSALELYRRALSLDDSYAGLILTNMGVVLKDLVRIPEAIACLEQSIAVRPDVAETHYNLGLTLYEIGRTDEAESNLRRAIELKPDFAAAHSTLLCIYGLNRNHEADRVYSEHRRWAVQFADPLMPKQLVFDNVLSIDRRLTIA